MRGVLVVVNEWIDSREFLTTMLAGAVAGLAGWWGGRMRRRLRLAWSVPYDEPINVGNPLEHVGADPAAEMWDIFYQPEDGERYEVTNGSLVVLEMRNAGRVPISKADYDDDKRLTVRFPGRTVVHFKIRDDARYRERVIAYNREHDQHVPGTADSFDLPFVEANRNEGFKILVLLRGQGGNNGDVSVEGRLIGGRIVRDSRRPRRLRVVAGLAALALLLGVGGGVWLANRALAPAPACAGGTLYLEGSTAFAPIANQVAAEYEQHCKDAQIFIDAVGSGDGLKALTSRQLPGQVIAMVDGDPGSGAAPGAPFQSRPVGVVIFAVVGHDNDPTADNNLPQNVFSTDSGGGMSDQEIADAFAHPVSMNPVGRSSASGTRNAFVHSVLGGDDAAETAAQSSNNANCVPGSAPAPPSLCLADTTMSLLTYVNDTPKSLGYAEADALPFFPKVKAISIGGYAPTRDNALAGHYSFLATEHLWTDGAPTGLAADFLSFLQSSPVTAQLRATSFIACSDLGGTSLSGACDN